jgi:hypothetical protein
VHSRVHMSEVDTSIVPNNYGNFSRSLSDGRLGDDFGSKSSQK